MILEKEMALADLLSHWHEIKIGGLGCFMSSQSHE